MGWTPKLHRLKRPDGRPYFRARVGGKSHYLGTDYATAAKRFAELLGTSGLSGARPASLAVAMQRYGQTRGSPWVDAMLKAPNIFRTDALLADVDAEWLSQYAAWLADGRKPQTVIHYVHALLGFLKWCKSQGWIDAVPARPKLPRPMRHPRDIPAGQLEELLAKVPAANRPILEFILATGCRPGEARGLKWDDVHLGEKTAILELHKTANRTGKPRTLYLTWAALEVLRRQPRSGEYVFPCRNGTPYSPSGLRSIIRRAGGTAVYPLRHTFAQNALESPGVRLEDVAMLLGHSGLRTVEVYAQVRNQRGLEVAASLVPPGSHRAPVAPAETSAPSASPAPPRKRPARRRKCESADGRKSESESPPDAHSR